MEQKGDIPERKEVKPESINPEDVSTIAKLKTGLVEEILEHGEAHVYLGYTSDGEDVHLTPYTTHVFSELGVIYVNTEDVEKWIFGDDIETVERHYE